MKIHQIECSGITFIKNTSLPTHAVYAFLVTLHTLKWSFKSE